MRRALFAVVCAALVALGVPTTGSADVLTVYGDLVERDLRPAPLVPTAVPRSLRPIDETIEPSGSRRRSGYGLRLLHFGRNGPDAIIVLEGGSYKTVKAALRDGRRAGYKARRTRVRGRRGSLLTRKLGRTQRILVWAEDGRVYMLGTGTPRKVPLKRLRETAAGLDRLGSSYLGTHADPDNSSEALAVTTERTITTRVDWESQCVDEEALPAGIYAGSAQATLVPRQPAAFALDIATHRLDDEPWTGTVAGTISPAAINLTVEATGTIDGLTCTTGSLPLTLARFTGGPD